MRVEPTLDGPCHDQFGSRRARPPRRGGAESFLSSTRPHHNRVTGVTMKIACEATLKVQGEAGTLTPYVLLAEVYYVAWSAI